MYEVEMKFAVENVANYLSRIDSKYKVVWSEEERQEDLFFQHMSRDFRQTDECLRIRRDRSGLFITYKGPVLDTETKSREEIELPLDIPGKTSGKSWEPRLMAWRKLLARLSFSEAACLVKYRKEATFREGNNQFALTLDRLDGIGYFTEIEMVVESDEELPEAKKRVMAMAKNLGLTGPAIRQSYLAMYLSQKE